MCCTSGLDPADRSSLQDAIEEIHHLDRLIENLLFLARAESGEVTLNRRLLDTAAFIDQFAQDVQVIAENARIDFAVTANEPLSASVDADRIRQVGEPESGAGGRAGFGGREMGEAAEVLLHLLFRHARSDRRGVGVRGCGRFRRRIPRFVPSPDRGNSSSEKPACCRR